MSERQSEAETNGSEPFRSPRREAEPDPESFSSSSPSSKGGQSKFILNMAEMWVKEHQEAAMLGAFAFGVFVGSLFRD